RPPCRGSARRTGPERAGRKLRRTARTIASRGVPRRDRARAHDSVADTDLPLEGEPVVGIGGIWMASTSATESVRGSSPRVDGSVTLPDEAPTGPTPHGGLHGSAPWFLAYHALLTFDYDLTAEFEP